MENKNEEVELVKQEDEDLPDLPDLQDFYTVTDIAKMAGISRQRIHQLIDAGAIVPDIITAFAFIFKRKTVEKWVKNYTKRIR